MNKVKILVIEDELIIAEDMRMMLESLGYEVVGTALDYAEAIECLDNSNADIVLTDIALGGARDGVELARVIRNKYQLPFIFVTSHSDKSTLDRAKSVQPMGYLVKPFEAEDLYACIEVALAKFEAVDPQEDFLKEYETPGVLLKDCIYVKEGHLLVKVVLNELLWIKSEGNYLELHTKNKRHVIRSSMKEFMNKLPANHFFRVHKSYAVNLERMDAINNLAVLVQGEAIPMGREFRELLLMQLKTA